MSRKESYWRVATLDLAGEQVLSGGHRAWPPTACVVTTIDRCFDAGWLLMAPPKQDLIERTEWESESAVTKMTSVWVWWLRMPA